MKRTSKAALLALCVASPVVADPVAITVTARAETAGTRGDVDDPAIWVNQADPAASLILGSDKDMGGLHVYDLTGANLAFFPDGILNNVDLRPFMLNGEAVTLVGASRRDVEELVFYVIDAAGNVRQAEPFSHAPVPEDMVAAVDDIYGFTMAQDAVGTYAVVNFKSGDVIQWRVTEDAGQLALTFARAWKVGSQPEGMLGDDKAGHIYVGEEDVGIWRFPMSPDTAAEATAIDTIPSACLPEDDVEGLAVYDGADARYLVASAQGVNRAVLYRLDGDAVPDCIASVEIAAGAIDGVSETDGLDVTALPLGPDYPQGLLVMMDDQNAGFTINFKLIGWDDIAPALSAP
jgi:3-phytase